MENLAARLFNPLFPRKRHCMILFRMLNHSSSVISVHIWNKNIYIIHNPLYKSTLYNQQTRGRFDPSIASKEKWSFHLVQIQQLPLCRLSMGMGLSSTKASVENCPILGPNISRTRQPTPGRHVPSAEIQAL